MTQRSIDAIVAGHVCLDIIPRFPAGTYQRDEVFIPGRLINIEEATIATGGPVSNTGIPLSKLGIKTTFMARTGTDGFGRITRDILGRWADTEGIVESPESYSSYTVVLAPPGIDRIFFHAPATNDTFGPEDINEKLCAQARLFHFGYPPLMRRMYTEGGWQLVEVFRKAREAGATTSLDMSLPDPVSEAGRLDWTPILRAVLPYVDIFQPSAEEALYMTDRSRYDALKAVAHGGDIVEVMTGAEHAMLSERFLAWGAKIVTLKTAQRGFFARSASAEALMRMGAAKPGAVSEWADQAVWRPAYRAPEGGSATGAGDCAIAGFLAAFLKGRSLADAARCAVAAAWQNLHVLDATSGIGDWDSIRKIVDTDNLDILGFQAEPDRWIWDKPGRIYCSRE